MINLIQQQARGRRESEGHGGCRTGLGLPRKDGEGEDALGLVMGRECRALLRPDRAMHQLENMPGGIGALGGRTKTGRNP